MLPEVLDYLAAKAGDRIFDGTLGAAGYTLALAARVGSQGQITATDRDPAAIQNAKRLVEESDLKNVQLIQDNFKNIKTIVAEMLPAGTLFEGIVVDLGLSSAQLADNERGFSFQGERPLEMAFGPDGLETSEIIARYPLADLTRIFRDYGEERFAYQIAKAIVEKRKRQPLKTTKDLVETILSALPARFRASRLNPATKVFQALRMESNQELSALQGFLPAALECLAPAGRLVVVSFHSGEDRIVKNFFRDHGRTDLSVLTKKPIGPTLAEITANPRARSAKLRAAQKR